MFRSVPVLKLTCMLVFPGVVSIVAGSNVSGYVNGAGNLARFWNPTSATLSIDETQLYVTEQKNNNVRRVDLATGMLRKRKRNLRVMPSKCRITP